MARLGPRLADAQAQRVVAVQHGVGQVELTAAVEPLQQAAVGVVAGLEAKADQVQRRGRGQLEARVVPHPGGELLGQLDVAPHVMLQTLHAVVADDEPQLERPEAPAKLNVPVAVVEDRARLGGLVLEVLRQDAQRAQEAGALGHPEAVAVEVGPHPLVRVEGVAVGQLQAVLQAAKLRAERGRAAHGRVHVEPHILGPADLADSPHRIHCVGRGGADRGTDEAGQQPGRAVGCNLLRQRVGPHGEVLIHGNQTQVVAANAGDLDRFLHRGVGLAGCVSRQSAVAALGVAGEAGGALATGQHGRQHRAAGRVLDHPAAG